MVEDIRNYLKIYITENGIPLTQVLTDTDLHQLSVSIHQLTKSKIQQEYEDISDVIFRSLGDKTEEAVTYPISAIPFTIYGSKEDKIANIALLGYYCFMYFRIKHDLSVEKILSVVNHYMIQHIVEKEDTYKVNCNNPISNLIPINDNQYVRFNGRSILPPFDEIKEEFIQNINKLLIK